MEQRKNLVIICSVIKTVPNPLSYTNIRSIFNEEERFEQTLKTIESVKKHIPNTYIAHLECSDLKQEYAEKIKKNVDEYINYFDNERIKNIVTSPYKGWGEQSVILEYLLSTNLKYNSIFKISGRYFIIDDFEYKNFDNNYNCFKLSGDTYSTVLYKIVDFKEYISALKNCEEQLKKGEGIETVMTQKFKTNTKILSELGVTGKIAVDGCDLKKY